MQMDFDFVKLIQRNKRTYSLRLGCDKIHLQYQ